MRKHLLILLCLIILTAVGIFSWMAQPDNARLSVDAVAGRAPKLSKGRIEYIPTVKIANAVGWPAGETPTPAKGLKVAPFATGLDHPRWLYRLPNGDILVAETNSPPRSGGGIRGWIERHLMKKAGAGVPSANRITLLRDSNGDGRADQRSVLIGGLNSPFGMALVGDWLYIADTDALLRVPYKTGETKITAKPEKVIGLPHGGEHWTRSLLANPKDGTLWIGVGSSSNIAENGLDKETNRAAIWSVNPKTKAFTLYASGMRNPVGMAINPVSGELWAVVNERDMLGSDMPPDFLTEVDFGNFYGWPWAYWGGYPDVRVQPERPELMEYVARPDYALGPHVAPLGLAFAGNIKLGGQFARGAFVGEHGSWNRRPPSGYKVVFVPFAANGFPAPDAKPVDVLTGFLNAKGQARGRPVGVIGDATGAMLVADDVGNVIWRVTPAAGQSAVQPEETAGPESAGK